MKAPAAIVLLILAVAVSAAFPPPDIGNCFDGSIPFSDMNAADQPNPDGGCYCVSYATWDNGAGYCNPHCETITHSNSQPYDTTANTGSCACSPAAYQFNQTTGTCDLNCNAVANSANTPSVGENCTCATSAYVWSSSNTTCTLDCTLVVNSTNVTNAAGLCDCIAKYKYESATSLCIVNCNDIQNTDLAVSQPSPTSCACGANYTWNAAGLRCDVDCTTVTNATGSDGNGGCVCAAPYSFVGGVSPACQLNCS